MTRGKKIWLAVSISTWGVLSLVMWFNTPENLWLTIKPFPRTGPVDSLRAESLSDLRMELANISEASPFSSFSVALQDKCYSGENNSWREDGFANICTARLTGYYGFDGDFRQKFLEFDTGLKEAGWRNEEPWQLQKMLDAYDRNYHKPFRYGASYLVSHLPTPDYLKGSLRLDMSFAEKLTDRKGIESLESFQNIVTASGQSDFHYENVKLVRVAPLFREVVAKHHYMAAVSVETNYFTN